MTIKQVVKGFAKMIVVNGNKEDLKNDHWLLSVPGFILTDAISSVKDTPNWMNKLYKMEVDIENEDEISDKVAELIQEEIDRLVA